MGFPEIKRYIRVRTEAEGMSEQSKRENVNEGSLIYCNSLL